MQEPDKLTHSPSTSDSDNSTGNDLEDDLDASSSDVDVSHGDSSGV